jgi:transcriptional regulator with XRE-family HTH domain
MDKPHPLLKEIGAQIRKVRRAQGVSQENFAIDMGMARSYYSGVERGRRNLAALNLVRIAAALNVEVGELFPPMAELQKKIGKAEQD